MSLDAAFAKAAEGALRELTKRVEGEIVKLAARPSALYRPELVCLDDTAGENVFLGCEEISDYPNPSYRGARRYDKKTCPAWRATYHEVIAYGSTPEYACDEFDYLFQRSAWATRVEKR